MIDQELINRMEFDIVDFDRAKVKDTKELLANYKSLIEQNAELHKELAKLKGDRVFVVNEGKPYSENPPNNLAM
tara:strand:- start:190 stop:411 length:222 start_codon:yes stop_codon:yes gene_type:complete